MTISELLSEISNVRSMNDAVVVTDSRTGNEMTVDSADYGYRINTLRLNFKSEPDEDTE